MGDLATVAEEIGGTLGLIEPLDTPVSAIASRAIGQIGERSRRRSSSSRAFCSWTSLVIYSPRRMWPCW